MRASAVSPDGLDCCTGRATVEDREPLLGGDGGGCRVRVSCVGGGSLKREVAGLAAWNKTSAKPRCRCNSA